MGIVANQSIKNSLVAYVGVVIGVINSLFIYPLAFQPEELGLVRFIMDTATLCTPFILLGIGNITVKYFPTFKNETNNNGFFGFLLALVAIGLLILLLLFLGFKGKIENTLIDNNKSLLIIKYWKLIIPLVALFVVNQFFTRYIFNFFKIVVPEIINNLYIKIILPLLALAYYFEYINLSNVIYGILATYILGFFSFLIYLKYLKALHFKINFSILKKPLLKEMSSFAGYSIMGNLGNVLATRIDVFMIAMLSAGALKDVGVYTIAVIISNIMIVPAKAMYSISSPIIAKAWKENNIAAIASLYKRTSILLLSVGVLVLVGILSSIEDLFKIMPNGDLYNTGIWVVLILGIAKIAELATSVNQQIIEYSKFYKFNFYAVLILAVLNIVNNYLFIPIFQLEGAALATMCSVILFNLAKLIFIRYKFKMQPFHLNSLKIIVLGITIYFAATFIPLTSSAFLNIIIRSVFIAFAFVASMLLFNISTDFTNLFWESLKRIGVRK